MSRSNDGQSRHIRRKRARNNIVGTRLIAPESITLPLDHFNKTAGTFENRYWVNEEFYKPGGPIFMFDAGEGDAEDAVGYLTHPTASILVQMAREFKGMALLWEHRFYGQSVPQEINTKTPATVFKHLTTEQALADVPAFAWNFTRSNFSKQDLTPASTPWVFIGGSYPGMRAAFVRSTYPETIFASYASSAPVEASIDMSFYFEPIWQGMQRYNVSHCAADIHAAILEMDIQMDDPKKSFALKEKFLGAGAGQNPNGGFANALTVIFNRWQGNGLEGDAIGGLGDFCKWISTDPVGGKVSGPEGFAKVKGAQFTIDRWANWTTFTRMVNSDMGVKCSGPDHAAANISTSHHASASSPDSSSKKACNLELPYQDPSSISWTWQFCSEWGFFQTANLGKHQLVSKHHSLVHAHETCHKQFPDGLKSGLLPEWPDVNAVNEKYGGWDVRPSNTFWGANEFDPWRTLSPLSDMPFSPKNIANQKIPKCGTGDEDEDADIFGYVLRNAQHCDDMMNDAEDSWIPRALFTKALHQWLGCFKKGKKCIRVKTRVRRVMYGGEE
ncbi:peptidase S28 [Tothia fuscella]|uniref:Peptidase S28 n=1 Tax=Tothia fuscella TaxID=1048955 RepID=A0A9P4TS80_9PEZI|nr:peptidase S28 [Tothia fuscella]